MANKNRQRPGAERGASTFASRLEAEIVSLPSLPYLRIHGLDSQNPLIFVDASNLDHLKLIEIWPSFMVSRPKNCQKIAIFPLVSSGTWQLRTPREAGPARHQELGAPAFHQVQKIKTYSMCRLQYGLLHD